MSLPKKYSHICISLAQGRVGMRNVGHGRCPPRYDMGQDCIISSSLSGSGDSDSPPSNIHESFARGVSVGGTPKLFDAVIVFVVGVIVMVIIAARAVR